ncbi:MAG: alkaline phosphatase [Salinibacter sp.]|uniref:alkaline phosphatase D family protein n=1 Tax=Salinibacter sp. TaxID=2065818 RepID=UPI0035D4311F
MSPTFLRRPWGAILPVILIFGAALSACHYVGPWSTAPVPPDSTTVLWAGGVTDSSARVVARPEDPQARVRLAVDQSGTWTDPTLIEGARAATNRNVRHFRLTDLAPRTTYHYALSINGRIDTTRSGQFQTFADRPFSFRVALGACARTGSNHPVFGAIRKAQPDLFLHMGDMHYEDIDETTPGPFRTAYRTVHASPRQSALFRSTALAYVWDDHDYGPNNSSRQAPGQRVAQQVYREYVPHYDLARDDTTQPIYQAFTIGRVRFLLTDLRSARTPNETPDSLKTMMGTEQKAWFKEQLARAKDRYPVVAWVSSVPWIGDDASAEDRWAGFAAERRELATYIDSIGVADQLVVLSGDAHMVALDDGTHNHYGQDEGGGFPVVHAAAFDQVGSVKGGPYTHGPHPNPFPVFGRTDGQFVLMDVRDNGGDEVCVTWTGKRYKVDADRLVTLLEWTKCFSAP